MQDFDVIIVGGGLVGYSFALDLAKRQRKFKIAIIEAKPPQFVDQSTLDSRIYAITPANIKYFKTLNVNCNSLRHGVIEKMDVYGDTNSNLILDKNTSKNHFLAKTLEYKILQEALYKEILQLDNIKLVIDNINTIEYGDYAYLSSDNTQYKARLLVGADGANSLVRNSAQIHAAMFDYQQSGIVANFECELPHHDIAYQWFQDGEVLAYLPLANNYISIVYSSHNPEEMLDLSSEDFAFRISELGHFKLGKLKLINKPLAFPLKMFVVNKVYADKVVLIGDAAHTLHPLAGQGVNLGFEDAENLARMLATVENYQLGEISVLAKYNVIRQISIKKMQLICHILYKMFKTQNSLIKFVRNKGLNLVNRAPLLKNILALSAN